MSVGLVHGRLKPEEKAATMAAFAAGVKIDTLAYSPLMDFGNAFSTAIAQNYGAGDQKRIKECVIASAKMVVSFALLTSVIIYAFALQFK